MRTSSPGSISRTYSRIDEIEGASLRGDQPGVAEAAEAERAKTAGIANGVKLIAREHEQRIGAFDLIERVAESAFQIVRRAASHQMHDDFGIAGGLENGAAMLESAAQLGGVGEIAVVRQGQLAFIAIDDDRLRIHQRRVARGGVARVSDGSRSREARQDLRLENFLHEAHALLEMQVDAIGRDDARRFLAAMLKSIETQIGELGGFEMAEDASDTAVIVKMIVVEMDHDCFDA